MGEKKFSPGRTFENKPIFFFALLTTKATRIFCATSKTSVVPLCDMLSKYEHIPFDNPLAHLSKSPSCVYAAQARQEYWV